MAEDGKAVLKMMFNYLGRAIDDFDFLSSDGMHELTKVRIENKLLHSGNLQDLITHLKRLVK